MKITTSASDLQNLLKTVGKALENRPITTWMKFILLEAEDDLLRATATNGMYTISNSCRCQVKDAGEAMLDGKLLCQLVDKLPAGEVTIEVADKGATLRYGKSKTKIEVSGETFKKPPKGEPTTTVKIDASEMRNLISTVRYAVSVTEDQRASINGILLSFANDTLRTVATDSFRLAAKKCECQVDNPQDIIIPGKAIGQLLDVLSAKNEEVELRTDGKWMELDNGSIYFRTTLLAGKFIPYQNILPKEFETKIVVSVNDLKLALERTMLVGEGSSAVKLNVSSDGVDIRALSAVSNCLEHIDCDVRGNEQEASFNGKYILAALNAMNSDAVWLKMPNAVRPTMMVPESCPDELHMVIPVRTY